MQTKSAIPIRFITIFDVFSIPNKCPVSSGLRSARLTEARRIPSYHLFLVANHPCVRAAKANIAKRAEIKTHTPYHTLVTPISNRSVLNININGSIAVLMSYVNPWIPVLMGFDLAIADAAKAANPTGGVSSAKIPKKNTKRCAAINGITIPLLAPSVRITGAVKEAITI